MPTNNDIAVGGLSFTGVPDWFCLETMTQLWAALEQYAILEIPTSISNVIVSNQQPQENERNKVWFRVDSSGSFVGFYLYGAGKWNQIYPISSSSATGVSWVLGDSRTPPDGYLLIDKNNPNVTAAQAAILMGLYIKDESGDFYNYYAVTYKGF